jgi:GNAT superfamily N-acetyltransferase
MDFPVIERLSPRQTEQLHQLYQNEWWTERRSLDQVKRMLAHSDLCLGVLDPDSDRLIGFARVLTDRVFKALIFDVIVDPEFRDKKLGALLMDAVLGHRDLRQIKHFELYCLPEMESFYRRWGFDRDVSGVALMRRATP